MPRMTTCAYLNSPCFCQEAKVLQALQYDLANPCLIQWIMLWLSAPNRLNRGIFNDCVTHEKNNEAISLAFQSAFILPFWGLNPRMSCVLKSINAVMCRSLWWEGRMQKDAGLETGFVACSFALWWKQWERHEFRWLKTKTISDIDDVLYLTAMMKVSITQSSLLSCQKPRLRFKKNLAV